MEWKVERLLERLHPLYYRAHPSGWIYNQKKMNKEFITLEESKDLLIGKVGTPKRDAYEEELKNLCHKYNPQTNQ